MNIPETENIASSTGIPVAGRLCVLPCVRLTMALNAVVGFALEVAPTLGELLGDGVPFVPKTAVGEGEVFTLVETLEENRPVNNIYPTASAASTNPIAMSLSHLGSSISAILPHNYELIKTSETLLLLLPYLLTLPPLKSLCFQKAAE